MADTLDMSLLRSATTIVAHRQINGECGGATVFCIVLADGFIVECGSDGYAQHRAKALAAAVNACGADRFSLSNLRSAQ